MSPRRLLALEIEPGYLPSAGRSPRELCPLLFEPSEHGLLKGDFTFELEASVAAVPPAEPLELALGGCDSFGCVVALLLELLLPAGVQARGLVDRERLGGRAFERARDLLPAGVVRLGRLFL